MDKIYTNVIVKADSRSLINIEPGRHKAFVPEIVTIDSRLLSDLSKIYPVEICNIVACGSVLLFHFDGDSSHRLLSTFFNRFDINNHNKNVIGNKLKPDISNFGDINMIIEVYNPHNFDVKVYCLIEGEINRTHKFYNEDNS